ncbi:MAG: ribonuclease P protein component [Gracilimonas sp.]|uniref:ribonuclease P protein component n=1 Tax=Gracilimonas TaxID=649462 RepID=UPI001B2B5A12|nr:ribonuclease P protein component [Gracilimonas sp.]MBO6584507.1 ribonuclease P protein component [Gracilimonas sp.]MBO6616222.1 ribonuclease P protein component [Gracilimonas sp.]
MREKEPSNHTDSPDRRFTLSKSHILRGRRNFEELFSSSSLLTSKEVNLRYRTYPDADKNVLVGFIAPKKIGNAVKRIRTKRLLREAYRLNQHIITELPEITEMGLHYVFMAKHANLTFDMAERSVTDLLKQLRSTLTSKPSPI